jgi:hypothetical protein
MLLSEDLRVRYFSAPTFDDFLDEVEEHRGLWHTTYRRARVAPAVAWRAAANGERRYLLVLLEDRCLDAVSTVPYLARLADMVPGMELRVVRREEHPDLMDAHLTGASRSVPVAMVLDADFEEVGWWGPRPSALQAWVLEHGLPLPREERLRATRRWYARDRGASTLGEFVEVLEGTAAVACVPV